MASVYRKVMVADRLPKESGVYVFIHKDGYPILSMFEKGSRFNDNIKYWLEEIELPTEEEIIEEVKERNNFLKLGFIKGANFIKNHIEKGGKG